MISTSRIEELLLTLDWTKYDCRKSLEVFLHYSLGDKYFVMINDALWDITKVKQRLSDVIERGVLCYEAGHIVVLSGTQKKERIKSLCASLQKIRIDGNLSRVEGIVIRGN